MKRNLFFAALILGCVMPACSANNPSSIGSDHSGSAGSGSGGGSAGSGGEGGTAGVAGGGPCGSDLDQTGCPCTGDEQPRDCFSGAPELAGVGVCSVGTQACVETVQGEQTIHVWEPCKDQGTPQTEQCNGMDDDCDGVVDPDCGGCTDGDTLQCMTECGAGQQTCQGGMFGPCSGPMKGPNGSCPSADSNCKPGAMPPTAWEAFNFTSQPAQTPCNGARFVRYMDEYSLWVGAALCTSTRYKIYLGTAKDATFYQVGDFAGNGQDHCELVNDFFTIPNEDDIKSGGCNTCDVGMMVWYEPGIGPVYSRAKFGDCFDFQAQWPEFNLYSVEWYECGVSIP